MAPPGFGRFLVHRHDLIALGVEPLRDGVLSQLQRDIEQADHGTDGHHVFGPGSFGHLSRYRVERHFERTLALEPIVGRTQLRIVAERAIVLDDVDISVVSLLVEGAQHVEVLFQGSGGAMAGP